MAGGKGFMALWSIGDPCEGKPDQQSKDCKEAFSKDLAEVAETLRQLVGLGSEEVRSNLAKQQDKAIGVYQKVQGANDSAQPEKAEKNTGKLLDWTAKLKQDALSMLDKAKAAYDEWMTYAALHHETTERVEQLDKGKHPKAPAFLKALERIDGFVADSKWHEAKVGLEALAAKVGEALDTFLADQKLWEVECAEARDALMELMKEVEAITVLPKPLAGQRVQLKKRNGTIQPLVKDGLFEVAMEAADSLADACDTFLEEYKAWLALQEEYEKLESELRPRITQALNADAFNEELRTEQKLIDKTNSNMVNQAKALDFKTTLIMAKDMSGRLDNFEMRLAALGDQAGVIPYYEAMKSPIANALAAPDTKVLAPYRAALEAECGAIESAILAEEFGEAGACLIPLDEALVAFQRAQTAFDNKIKEIESLIDNAHVLLEDDMTRAAIESLSEDELQSLPGALRGKLMKILKTGIIMPEDKAAQARLAETTPEDKKDHGKELAAAQKRYQDLLKVPKEKRERLKEQLGDLKDHLAIAEKYHKEGDHSLVGEWLIDINEDFDEAHAILDLLTGYPDEKSLKAVLDNREGAEALDKIIKGLPDNTPQQAFRAAIEARFGKEVELWDTPADYDELNATDDKSMKATYEALELLPDWQVEGNDRFDKFVRFADKKKKTSYYRPGQDQVEVACRGASTPFLEKGWVNPKDEGVPSDYQRNPHAQDAPIYTFTTLHEVGHAVDAKAAYMDKNQGKDQLGGWKEYGSNPSVIAEIAADHFGYDSGHILDMLNHKERKAAKFPKPPSKDEAAVKAWKDAYDKARIWCEAISDPDKNGLWWSASRSKKHAIGGRVYHKAYSSSWVSYNLAARSQGITRYQFRAPGEWFAEIYAAFYMGQLKSSNPHNKWLRALEKPPA